MGPAGEDGASETTSPRILLVSQPTSAGTARHVGDLAEGLARKGLSVTVACPGDGPLSARLGRAGIPHVGLPMQREIRPWHDLVSFVRLVRLCRRLRPDVLHAHSSKAGFLGRIAGRLAGVPVVVFTPHSWSFQAAQGKRRGFYVALERFASRFCDITIAVSEREALEATQSGVVTPQRIRVISNGVSAEEFEPVVSGTRDIPFVSVGRLDEQKGYSYLLEAMAELVHHEPGARLTIVGDGALREDLERQTASLGLEDVVTFEGDQVSARPYLRRAHVFVLSSLWEGLPYTIIEAMAARLPVVSADVGGCGELVMDPETGRLVPPRNPSALAAAMRELWRDEELRASMGFAGYHRASRLYRLESCVDHNAQAYTEGLEGARQARAERRRWALFGPRMTVAVVAMVLVLGVGIAASEISLSNKILPGITVGGANVGGLTIEEAARAINAQSSRPITVSVSATAPPIPLDGTQLQLDVMTALGRAYLAGRVGALPQRVAQRIAAARGRVTVPLEARSVGAVADVLADAHSRLDRAPMDAGFEMVRGELKLTPDQPGMGVDDSGFLVGVGAAATSPRVEDRVARVPVRQTPASVSEVHVDRFYAQAREWTSADVVGSARGASLRLPRAKLASLLAVKGDQLAVSEGRSAVALRGFRIPSAAPKNARLIVVGGKVRIVGGAPGTQVDATATAHALQDALESGRNSFAIATVHYEPDVTRADLAKLGITRQLSSFTTHFRLGQDGRDINISLSAAALRGEILGVGEVFSLNTATGPRNRATGYKEALIFLNGKVVPGIGGGVCQVSSTTYQAALRAGLHIVDRQSHSMAVTYLAPGLDATTLYPIVDLKFQNTTSGPILLWSEIRGNALTVGVYGSGKRPDIRIKTVRKKTIQPGTSTVYDTKLRHNVRVVEAAGIPGYIVASYRLFTEGGRVVKRESLAVDEYRPRKRVVRVGY